MKYFLSAFDDNKFALNQSYMPLTASLISCIEAKGLGLLTIVLESSAKRNVLYLLFMIFGRSLV